MFGLGNDDSGRLLYLLLLLAFLAAGYGFRRRLRVQGVGQLAIWAAIILALVALYSYRDPLRRFAEPVLAELSPNKVATLTGGDGRRELEIRRGADGHFHVDAEAGAATVRFMVDTGATSTVLSERDAERAGIDTASLRYDSPVQTANGIAMSARTTLPRLRIGPYELSDVRVGVMPDAALDGSLLGMNVIDRFSRWSVEGDRLVLTP